jgi:hypothetical protein
MVKKSLASEKEYFKEVSKARRIQKPTANNYRFLWTDHLMLPIAGSGTQFNALPSASRSNNRTYVYLRHSLRRMDGVGLKGSDDSMSVQASQCVMNCPCRALPKGFTEGGLNVCESAAKPKGLRAARVIPDS